MALPYLSWNVEIGQVVINTLLAIIGFALRKIYLQIRRMVHQHDQMYSDWDQHAEVLNLHTGLLVKGGLANGVNIPRVERRRHPRIDLDDLDLNLGG